MARPVRQSTYRRVDPLYFIMGCGGALLLTNRLPALAIGVTLATLYLGILALLVRGRPAAISGRPLALLGCIYAYLLLSYLASNQPISALANYEFLKNDGNFFFAYALFFAFTSPHLDYRLLFSVYHQLLLTIFSVFAVLGAIEMACGGHGILTRSDSGLVLFTALNKAHNATGSVYAAACVVALCALLFDSSTSRKRRRYSWFLAICLVGLLMTKSRGSLLAFSLAGAFAYYLRYGRSRATILRLVAFGAILVIMAFATGMHHRVIASFDYGGDYNIISRFQAWAKAWALFKLSPTIGVGFGRYNDIDPGAPTSASYAEGYPGFAALCTSAIPLYNDGNAHNSYLQFLAETGLFGLGLLLLFWYSVYRRLHHAFRISGDATVRLASALGKTNLVLLLVLSLTENYLSATTVMLFMSASIGMTLGLIGRSRRVESNPGG